MNSNTLPRLRAEAVVRPFDARGLQPRFVIAIDGHHYVVTSTVATALEETQRQRTDDNLVSLAARVSKRLGRNITAAQLDELLSRRLPKVLFEPAVAAAALKGVLCLRRLLFSGTALRPLLALLEPLFTARLAFISSTLFIVVGVVAAAQMRTHGTVLNTAGDQLGALALTIAGIFIHELGHLAACRRYRGDHGGIGIGIYWFLPAFYAEVHGAWLLPRRQRAVVDVGGVYFQAGFVTALGIAYLAYPWPALAGAILWSQLLMLHTLNPVMKFDGYWLLCDLAGAHNLHLEIRNIARRLFSCHRPRSSELLLLGAFAAAASIYFIYLFAVLGQNLGSGAAALSAALERAPFSSAARFDSLKQGALLALLLAMSFGLTLMLASAACSVFVSKKGKS